jgi:RNA 2',3'-cyclic 3'-phosphodiesterase
VRVFVALDIPEDVRASISDLALKLCKVCPNTSWVRIENAHVTLKFIGEVPSEKVEPIKAALATTRSRNPIEMKFRNVGFFPDERRPRVFWAGIEAGAELGELAAAVETALEPLGVAREKRVFSPHLTLARFESQHGLDRLRDAIAAAGPLEFGHAVAKELHLYQSVLKRGGAEYTRLATYHFEGDAQQ